MWLLEALGMVGVAVLFAGLTDETTLAVSIWVLWFVWRGLHVKGELPIISTVMTYHLAQKVAGNAYMWVTGRSLGEANLPYTNTYVLMGLGCVVALTLGIMVGRASMVQLVEEERNREIAMGWQPLLALYILMFLSRTALNELRYTMPSVSQFLVVLNSVRTALFYLIMRRFVRHEQYLAAGAFLGAEVAVGMTGYFSTFKEPLIITLIVLAEMFDRRNVMHWVVVTGTVVVALSLGAMWIGIRGTIRERIEKGKVVTTEQRLDSFLESGRGWLGSQDDMKWRAFDGMVVRIWDVYYPALSVGRVPSVLPHTNGEFMSEALVHALTPRFLFPDKAAQGSESVRSSKYSGLFLAGEKQGTSIAFGYTIESYVDYGLPFMFLPSLFFGVFFGVASSMLLRMLKHRELAVATVTIVTWTTFSLANLSWAKLLGTTTSTLLYLTPLCFLLDRWLLMKLPDELPEPVRPAVLRHAPRHV